MFTRLLTIWDQVRSSLWAVPLLMIVGAAVLAVAAVNFRVDPRNDSFWFLYSGDAAEAVDFLTSLMSSMITLAALVVSITMVVLTLAAQQLGPRLIKNFMADLFTQAIIGLFVATIVYLIIVLRTTAATDDGVPNLAVTVGTALVLLSIIGLPLFVHRLARFTVADNTIARVGAVLDETADDMLLEKGGDPSAGVVVPSADGGATIDLPAGGYIQAIDVDALVKAASAADCTIILLYRPGHHLIAGIPCAAVVPASALKDELSSTVEEAIIVGGERTPVQDVEFTVRQLVEIAARALSTGMNDPYTAVAAIDRLALSLGHIMRKGEAQSVWTDERGKVRVVLPASTFEGIVDAAFNEIRQVSGKDAAILIRIAEKLGQLMTLATKEQHAIFAKHLRLIANTARKSIQEPYDLQILEQRVTAALAERETERRAERAQAVG